MARAHVAFPRSQDKELDSTSGKDTPITRVVNLLKTMTQQLEKDMDQDEALYKDTCSVSGFRVPRVA